MPWSSENLLEGAAPYPSPGCDSASAVAALQFPLTPVMAATRQELEHGLFDDPAFEEKSLRFATDAGCQVVYITKERYLDMDEDGESIRGFLQQKSIILRRSESQKLTVRPPSHADHVPPAPPTHSPAQCERAFHAGTHQNHANSRLHGAYRRTTALHAAVCLFCPSAHG